MKDVSVDWIKVKLVGSSSEVRSASVKVTINETARILLVTNGTQTKGYPLEKVEWFEYDPR